MHYFVRVRDNSLRSSGRSRNSFSGSRPFPKFARPPAKHRTTLGAGWIRWPRKASGWNERPKTCPRSGERPTTGQNRGQTDETMSYESAKRAEAVAEAQSEMMNRAEALKEALEELQRSAEAAGLNDPAWQERLKEIQEQLDRALTPELRERLAESNGR